ncbi:MAG: glucosaminidase domain-containing protein [Alphaproteobacteria bacterium]|nr:glucosaminidase domain-containing protein [Alphaproteobacteria bacterium]
MNLHRTAIEFFQANRLACLAGMIGLAGLVLAAALIWFFGIDRGGLKPPEDSAALKRVRAVSLTNIRRTGQVRPAFVDRIDVDLATFTAAERKQNFFRMILPLVARENDRIRAERKILAGKPDAVPEALYKRYGVTPGELEILRPRVDIIPASLVLAQAALESGWGTSRFALHGNNLFGMRHYDPDAPGLVPSAAATAGFKLMLFDNLGDSVAAYMRNLNSHDAYRKLRAARAAMRRAGKRATGADLTVWLMNYSEIPEEYGEMLRMLIAREKLAPFDNVRLATDR